MLNTVDGEEHKRVYTPVTKINEKGKIGFVIKVYRNNEEFPKGGKLS